MNTPAIALPRYHKTIQTVRLRGLFAGLNFLLWVAAFVTVGWTIQYLLLSVPAIGLARSMRHLNQVIELDLMTTLLPMPFVAALLNRAPSAGAWRYALYALTVVASILWCVYLEPNGVFSGEWSDGILHHREWLAGLFDSAASVTLLVVAFGYYRTAASASDVLSRAQIDAARLDSELQSARLQLLQAQIEPHFLLNTIANVRTLARLQPSGAMDLIEHLERYFSAALPHIRESDAPLSDETRLVEAYLAIYRVRMGARLSYEVVLPPALAPVSVPTMILLTLVENAIKHGIAPAIEGGFIRVSAGWDNAMLELKVADSGCGLKPSLGTGSGLANCCTRLRLRYGERATLRLDRAEPRGVIATVHIPAEMLA